MNTIKANSSRNYWLMRAKHRRQALDRKHFYEWSRETIYKVAAFSLIFLMFYLVVWVYLAITPGGAH